MRINKAESMNIRMIENNSRQKRDKNNLSQELNCEKSPSNPAYWQSLAFSGNKKDENFEKCRSACNSLRYFYDDFKYKEFLKQSYALSKYIDTMKGPSFYELYEIIDGNEEVYDDMSDASKKEMLKGFSKIAYDEDKINDPDFSFVVPFLNKLKAEFFVCNLPVYASKERIEECNRSIFACKKENRGGLSSFENVMVNSIPKLKKMENGLNLKYNRQDFLNDLNTALSDKEKRENFAKQTGVILKVKDGKIQDYTGILNIDNLEMKNSAYKACRKFLYENEVKTGDKELDIELNKIIKASPEFINTIGRKNDKKCMYTLDIHQLLTLCYAINDEEYKNLSNKDKNALKGACLFSDIAFVSSFKNKDERNLSSIYSREILGKFIQNDEILNRIYRISKNHSRIKSYFNINSDVSQESLAYQLRGKNDLTVANIMAKADAKAMGGDFYIKNKDCFSKETMEDIKLAIKFMHANGMVLITDYPVSGEKTNEWAKEINGKKYKILNLRNIKNDEDMGKYGFHSGTKKKDLNFLVHMVSNVKNLENFRNLLKSSNDAVLSESLIAPKNKRTLNGMKYGFLLAQNSFDIINAYREDQGSGTKKNEGDAIEYIFDYGLIERRESFKEFLLSKLGISPKEVTDFEYAQFYNENLSGKTSFNQFIDDKKYNIGNKTTNGKMLKDAIKEYQNTLINNQGRFYKGHNEIIGTSPKIKALIAKEREAEKLPKELLDFAYKNDLPIIMI